MCLFFDQKAVQEYTRSRMALHPHQQVNFLARAYLAPFCKE